MKYTIYYGGNKVKIPGFDLKRSKKVWPKDTTEITFSIAGNILSYEISNLSDRTQYLYDNAKLGLGIFVEENPRWLSWKWRSNFAINTHETRHCLKVCRLDSLSGEIDLNTISGFEWSGCLSKQMYYVFNYSANYQEPYVESGTENIALGIGRMYNNDEDGLVVACFRPYKVSNYEEMIVYNNINNE